MPEAQAAQPPRRRGESIGETVSDKKSNQPESAQAEAAAALGIPPEAVAEKAKEWAHGEGFQAQIFKAIAV